MTPPTPKDRARWKALADAATPGPWLHHADADETWEDPGLLSVSVDEAVMLSCAYRLDGDGEFIAAAREAVPALLAEVERLRAALREVTVGGLHPDRCLGGAPCTCYIATAHRALGELPKETEHHVVLPRRGG